MRIIAGKFRGKKLLNTTSSITRETQDRIKENMFNLIGSVLNYSVLDLFCGTANLGLEALSRGASFCDFNDLSKEAYLCSKKNIDYVLTNCYRLFNLDYKEFLSLYAKSYDLILIDAPYSLFLDNLFLEDIAYFLNQNGKIVLEASSSLNILKLSNLTLIKHKKYGSKQILIYIKNVV